MALLARHLAGYTHTEMQFENNRCYSTVLHFAVSGTRLLYQQSAELLAKAVAAQTVLPGTKSCSQTTPPHRTMPHACPTAKTDNMAKGVYCKGRVSPHNGKTNREHRFHHGLQHPNAKKPRQASRQMTRILLTRENFQGLHAPDRAWQLQPEALCLSTSPTSCPFPHSQTRSRV